MKNLFLVIVVSALVSGCGSSAMVKYEYTSLYPLVQKWVHPLERPLPQLDMNLSDSQRMQLAASTSRARSVRERYIREAKIEVVRSGEMPDRPVLYFAKIYTWGSSAIDVRELEEKAIREAKFLGADVVSIVADEIQQSGQSSQYYSGLNLAVSQNIYTRSMLSLAGVYGRSTAGLFVDGNGVIEYVVPGGPADIAGLTEGNKILAVNGIYYRRDANVLAKEVNIQNPGTSVDIEYLDSQSQKKRVSLVLAPAHKSAR